MLQLRSECHTVWCWVQLPGHSSIPVDAAEGTIQHSTLRTDTNGWTQMTCRYHPTSMRCAPSAQSVWQLLTAMDSLKSQLHPLLSRSTYWPHHLWWAEWDRSKLLSTWMLVCPILNAERKKKVWESKEVYFTHCRVIVGTKQRKTALISSTRQNEAKKKKLSKTTDVHPAFSTTSTVSQVQEHSHLTPGSALQDYGAHWSAVVYRWERKSQDTIVSGWWGGGGGGREG